MKSHGWELLKGPLLAFLLATLGGFLSSAQAQEMATSKAIVAEKVSSASATDARVEDKAKSDGLSERERLLLERVDQLERRLAEVESRLTGKVDVGNEGSRLPNLANQSAPLPATPDVVPLQTDPADREALDFIRDTTFNVTLDGYYGYNFNRPVGGINLLRAYDVQANSFSLNQAALIIENAPNLEKGKRYGLRLDLQYGQATETVQGNAANEPRPQVYRNLWQAYGTYVFDVGKGLTVDFGKFAQRAWLRNQLHKRQLQLHTRLLL